MAVLDTNALASGFAGQYVSTSTPGELIRRWRREEFILVTSEHILGELTDTFAEPYFSSRLTPIEQAEALLAVRRRALLVPITASVAGVATHPEDDAVLATAVSAGAPYLVTGDRPFRTSASGYAGVTLVSPAAFLALLRADTGAQG